MPSKPKAEKATKSKATKKVAKSTPKPEPVVEEPAPVKEVMNPVVENTVVESTEPNVTEEINEFMSKLQSVGSQITSLKSDFRALEKKFSRELKQAMKTSQKKKRKSGNRAPSGFVKPTPISKELASFLGKPQGTEMARTEVTREINAYIREHKLQDSNNGRQINPDKALNALLKVPSGEVLTYFNLQRYMSCHFQKQNKSAPLSDSA